MCAYRLSIKIANQKVGCFSIVVKKSFNSFVLCFLHKMLLKAFFVVFLIGSVVGRKHHLEVKVVALELNRFFLDLGDTFFRMTNGDTSHSVLLVFIKEVFLT